MIDFILIVTIILGGVGIPLLLDKSRMRKSLDFSSYNPFHRREQYSAPVATLPYKELRCPSCKAPLTIEEMLDKANWFGPGAISFDCPHCRSREYFAPYDGYIETGGFACSPVMDLLPREYFSYPPGFEIASHYQDGILNVQIQSRSWSIPDHRMRK